MFSATAVPYPFRMLKRINKYSDKSCATSEIEIKPHPSLLFRYPALTTKYLDISVSKDPLQENKSLEDAWIHFSKKVYFLKSIAAIIHFRAIPPPYTREAFRPHTPPEAFIVFVHPQISVWIPFPLQPSAYFSQEDYCHHTFLSIAASTYTSQPKKHSGLHTPLAP